MKPPISLELFKKYIGNIITFHDLQDGISNATRRYNNETKDIASFELPTLESDLIELLGIIFDDENDWIGYWVYELECGARYEDGCVVSTSGGQKTDIKLKTVEDLWNLLISDEN